MALFSQRKGIRPVSKAIQRESMDDDLRNCLWSALDGMIWSRWSSHNHQDGEIVEALFRLVWVNYLKKPLDEIHTFYRESSDSPYSIIRSYFFKGKWWQRYDLIEFLLQHVPDKWTRELKDPLNHYMEAENAAYRIVGDKVVEITDEQEIEAIESAIEAGIKTCRKHLARALQLLSDRKDPDYRNSIKESISAVEAVCRVIAGKPKATLGDCIKIIKAHGAIHGAFEQALLKLYGYTSDESGIRHSLTEESEAPAYSDAKFMLVACSAFVNFLLTKAAELDIDIGT